MTECRIDRNKTNCNCTYEPCGRKGVCCECILYHRRNGELPACYFPKEVEKTFNRSIEAFMKTYHKKSASV